jgi:hypothetical protein
VKSIKFDFEDTINDDLAHGRGPTMLLRLDNVGGPDNASVPGALYRVAPGHDPAAEHVAIDAASLDPAGEPLVTFPDAYMANGTWVSGNAAVVPLAIPSFADGVPFELPLERATISFDVESGKNGLFAGAVRTFDMHVAVEPIVRALGGCPTSVSHDAFHRLVDEAPDLSADATNLQNPSGACDAISVGIGFDVTSIGAAGDAVHVDRAPLPSCN